MIKLSQIQKITMAAVMIVLTIIFTRLLSIQNIPVIPFVRISLGPAVVILASLILGPIYGGIVGGAADILGIVLFPNGFDINPILTIVYAASGVLPIAVGRATKFFDYFLSKDKEYYALVQFGYRSDTLDSFGEIEKVDNKIITSLMINDVKSKFIGEIEQIPPKYSAIKINGKKACDLARENIDFDIKPRKIHIYSIELKEEVGQNSFLFKVNCSAGTYIRTLFSDMAISLGTDAIVSVIIRSKSGMFDTKNAITIEELEQKKILLKIEDVFSSYKFIEVDENFAKKIINGLVNLKDEKGIFPLNEDSFITIKGNIIGLFCMKDCVLSRKVFIYSGA